mmetsp:Transcript_20937/g.48517  ORF Transcript_20937/g.48517 Transcript_20937/m.48517 type:complete len:119 (-) Transcript_20937:88-444(-)
MRNSPKFALVFPKEFKKARHARLARLRLLLSQQTKPDGIHELARTLKEALLEAAVEACDSAVAEARSMSLQSRARSLNEFMDEDRRMIWINMRRRNRKPVERAKKEGRIKEMTETWWR